MKYDTNLGYRVVHLGHKLVAHRDYPSPMDIKGIPCLYTCLQRETSF